MPRITIAAKLKQLETDRDHAYMAAEQSKQGWAKTSEALTQALADRDLALRGNSNLSTQVADLQERLFTAERENERMRGYIARVQEDDVVREDLVTTGDPAGEQVLEPKRRPTQFARPGDQGPFGEVDMEAHCRNFHRNGNGEPPRKPLHWIRYGR